MDDWYKMYVLRTGFVANISDPCLYIANQNTQIYGRLDDDGIWRDPKDGSELEDMGGRKSGPSAIISGLAGTLRRVQGKGGFGT